MDWNLTEESFTLSEPQRLRPWYNYISNQEYGLKISHLGDAQALTLAEPRLAVTHYDFFAPLKGRFVYVNQGGEIWNPSANPCRPRPAAYRCEHAPGFTRITGEREGLRVSQLHFLPRSGSYEIMLIEAEATGKAPVKASLYPLVEFLLYPDFGIDPTYYCWFSSVGYDQASRTILFDKRAGARALGFCRSVTEHAGWEGSMRSFWGDGDAMEPELARTGALSSEPIAGDPYGACFRYDLSLEPGRSASFALILGAGEPALEAAKGYPGIDAVKAEFHSVAESWRLLCSRPEFGAVEDPLLKAWLRGFFPYQLRQQALGAVRGIWRGFRDVAQDAMGLVPLDPAAAKGLLRKLCSKQYRDGRCVRQWNAAGGPNDERDFRDLGFWIMAALARYAESAGDPGIYAEKAPFIDSPDEASLWEHAILGMRYCLKLGAHGLVEMGRGDWNDALSGLGPRAGSVFLNQFAYWVVGLAIREGKGNGLPLDLGRDPGAIRDELYAGVMRRWTGEWFARAVAESGRLVGGSDRIFLLPQAWFTISGMAERDPAVAALALDSMMAELETDEGLLKCSPGFVDSDPEIGDLAALAPGTAENYAVYNHAQAFALYALLMAGRSEEATRLLWKILPLRKDWRKTRAEPYVLVNYYDGGYYPRKAGRGGIPWLTGTVNWLSMAIYGLAAGDLLASGVRGKD